MFTLDLSLSEEVFFDLMTWQTHSLKNHATSHLKILNLLGSGLQLLLKAFFDLLNYLKVIRKKAI